MAPTKKSKASKPTPEKTKKTSVVKEQPAESPEDSESEQEEGEEETIYESRSDDSAIEEGSEDDENVIGLDQESDSEEESDSSEVDEEALLAGIKGSDDEEEESSESDQEEEGKAYSKVKLDLDGKEGKEIRAQLDSLREQKSGKPGVVYIGRIPHGFYEEEMTGYFSQFGEIKNLRISRNPRTGRSRHYGFIEFEHHQVAKIVADTMNNYLMFDKLLKCVMLPEDKVHPSLFAIKKKAKYVRDKNLQEHKLVHDRQRTQEEVQTQVDRMVEKENKKRAKMADLGIDYDFPGVQGVVPPKAKHVKYDD